MITVVNKYHTPYPPSVRDVYIGRPSVLENPFPVKTYGCDQCIALCERHLIREIQKKNPAILTLLNEIYNLHMAGHNVNLICYCAPKACHGDLIKRLILAKEKRNQSCAENTAPKKS